MKTFSQNLTKKRKKKSETLERFGVARFSLRLLLLLLLLLLSRRRVGVGKPLHLHKAGRFETLLQVPAKNMAIGSGAEQRFTPQAVVGRVQRPHHRPHWLGMLTSGLPRAATPHHTQLTKLDIG